MFRWSSKLAALAVSSSLGLMAQGGTLELVSVSYRGGPSSHGSTDPSPDISDDGRFVVFDSVASDLVINDTNSVSDVFVRDLWQQTTTCVTVDAAGKPIGGYSGGFPATVAMSSSAVLQADSFRELAEAVSRNCTRSTASRAPSS